MPRASHEKVLGTFDRARVAMENLLAEDEARWNAREKEHAEQLQRLRDALVAAQDQNFSEQLARANEALAQQTHAKVVVLGADVVGKAQFVVLVSHEGMEAGLNAGQLVKLAAEHCQGGGGGKPNFAQAGGKDGQAVGRALELVQSAISQSLAAAKA